MPKYKCSICGESNKNNFYNKKYYVCKKCKNLSTTLRAKRRREFALEILGNKCVCCGYDKCKSSLDIHHINPEIKDKHFNNIRHWNYERILKELENCILLCKNCHTAFHCGELFLSEDIIKECKIKQNENKEIVLIKYLPKNNNNENEYVKEKFCIDCGKPIYNTSIRCIKCSNKNKQQKDLSDIINREDLKELIRNKSFEQIARDFGYSSNAIRKWCIKYNLPKNKREIKEISDEEWIKI